MSDENQTESVYRVIPMVGAAYVTPKGQAEPAARTVRWWGLRKSWPAWLVEAMAIQRHINEELSEDEAHELAETTCGLPLGAKRVGA